LEKNKTRALISAYHQSAAECTAAEGPSLHTHTHTHHGKE